MSANAQPKQGPDVADVRNPEATATTCIVGCKLPHGLKLELFDKRASTDGKGVPLTRKLVAVQIVKGNNAARIVGGYGLTENVPTAFMIEWLKQNAEHPAVSSGAIFMHNNGDGALARAKDGRGISTGLEAIDPIAEAKKFRLEAEPDDVAAYRQQVATNPDRNRQIVE